MTKYLALLVTVGALGCQQEKPPAPAALMVGCHRNGDLYYFDNDHFEGTQGVGYSHVSCEYAKDNWMHTPDPAKVALDKQMNHDRDPKIGLLP